jgi:Cu(I)/Ag(I) efflux system membrane protein CusA/SilA
VPGVSSALAERLTGGRYVDVDIDRAAAARFGLNIADVQAIVAGAIGGETIGETVEGLARYPISVRYPRELRDSLKALRELPILTRRASRSRSAPWRMYRSAEGPPMLKTENARPSTWVYVDVRGRDLASVVTTSSAAVARDRSTLARRQHRLLRPVRISRTGPRARLKLVVPATLLIIFVLLYMIFGASTKRLLIMGRCRSRWSAASGTSICSAITQSVATGVGFIALAGVSAEFGVVMLIYSSTR